MSSFFYNFCLTIDFDSKFTKGSSKIVPIKTMVKGSGGGSKAGDAGAKGSSGSHASGGAGATRAATDNRSNQLNPNNPTYHSSRAHG